MTDQLKMLLFQYVADSAQQCEKVLSQAELVSAVNGLKEHLDDHLCEILNNI